MNNFKRCALALVTSLAWMSPAAADSPCKNHYILREPCGPEGVPALDAAIGAPGAVATAPDGTVYFSSPNIVFKFDPASGLVTRVAGNGTSGYGGDGGPATDALLSFPTSYPELEEDPIDFEELLGPLAVGPDGVLYIGDAYNNRVRQVDAAGIISTVIAPTEWPARWPQGLAVDAANNLYVSYAYGELEKRAPDGGEVVLAFPNCGADLLGTGLCAPEGIAVDSTGSVYVVDDYCRVRRVDPDGTVTTVAGMDWKSGRYFTFTCGYSGNGVPALEASLQSPFGVAFDGVGNLFIADTYNNCVRKVDGDGIITTFAGTCCPAFAPVWRRCAPGSYGGDGGPASDARLLLPHGVAADRFGNVYIADTGNNRIRMVDPDGTITTVAGNGEEYH